MVIHGEIVCCICQGASSRDNNEIVLCDKCGAGKGPFPLSESEIFEAQLGILSVKVNHSNYS